MADEISAAEEAKKAQKLKETKEFVAGAIDLAKLLSAEFKDGIQPSDLIDIARKVSLDQAFRTKMWEAVKGIQTIPSELQASSPVEILTELGQAVLDSLTK